VAAVKAERYGQEFLDIATKYTCKMPGKQASVELVRNCSVDFIALLCVY